MFISSKLTPGTIVTSKNKYSIKNSLLRDGNSNCGAQFCSFEGETVSKLETATSGMTFKGCTSVDEINEKFPSLQHDEFSDILEKNISDEILNLLYIISIYTINNCKATAGSKNCSFPELYQYLDQIIPLSNKNKIQSFETAADLKPPDFVVDVQIVEALRLKWKKYLEFSRLYCKMWVSSNPEQVKFTNPVDLPICPIWNENYRLNVKDPEEDALVIEIRKVIVKKRSHHFQKQQLPSEAETANSSDETKVLHEHPEDYLFGWSEVRLSDVFCEGTDTWIPVKSIKNGTTKGYLHIVMKIGISSQNGGIYALKRHLLLTRLCIEDCLKVVDCERMISTWVQIVSPTASTLLHLHSVIEGIPICEDIISWFIVINHMAVNKPFISIQFIHNLLLGCEKNIRHLSCVKGSIDYSLEKVFKLEVENLNKRCLKMIENLHNLELAENKSHRNDFEYSLRIIQISNGFLKLRNDPVSVMKSEGQMWLEKASGNIPTPISDKIKYLIDFIECTKDFLNAADRIIVKVYPEVAYTIAIYEYLDKFLQTDLKDNVKEIALELIQKADEKDKFLMDALKLFKSSKNLLFYVSKVTKDQSLEERFESLCLGFGKEIIESWFNQKTRVAVCQIKMALCFDDLMGMKSYKFGYAKEKISSTAKVIPDILRTNLVELWEIVSIITFSNYNRLFIKSLHDCCILFVSGLLSNSPTVVLSADKRKTTRKKLYVVANDLNFLVSFVEQTISNTFQVLPPDVVDLKAFLSDASQKVCVAISESLLFVANKRIKRVIEAENKLKQKVAVQNYASIMKRKIQKEASQYLASDAFVIFLQNFGLSILDIIQNYLKFYDNLKSNEKKSNLIFQGLLEVSKETKKLCLGLGEMNTYQIVWQDEFKELERKMINFSSDIEALLKK